MNELNGKIASILIESLSLDELEAIVALKKSASKHPLKPKQLTKKEKLKNHYKTFLLKKLHAPNHD